MTHPPACWNCGDWLEPESPHDLCRACLSTMSAPAVAFDRRTNRALAEERNRAYFEAAGKELDRIGAAALASAAGKFGACPYCGKTFCTGEHADCQSLIAKMPHVTEATK